MAGELTKTAVEAGTKAVMDLSLSAGAFSVSLKIDNVWLAGAVSVGALSLGAFYLACRRPAEDAIRRALERKLFGEADPRVTNITDGHSILIELHCSTETSFLVFLEDLETNTTKFRLEAEFQKIGLKSELDVSIRNAETVYRQAGWIRERSTAQRDDNEQVTWKQKYEELAKMVNKMYMKLTLVSQIGHTQTTAGTEETMNRLQWLERHFTEKARQGEGKVQGEENLQVELENVKETLKREMAISKGLRRTIEKLQEGTKGLGKTTEHEKVDGIEMKNVNEQSRIMLSDFLELREKVHELEKENESLQHKLKKKDKELERFHSLETGSGTFLSEEDPDESALEIIQMPRSQVVQEGKKFVLSCRARGLPDIRYRWVKDDVDIPGANRSDLVLEPVRMQDFGHYVCRVWDKSGSATSDTAEIDVFPASQMRFRGLHEIDTQTKQAVVDLLSKKRLPGLATWKQVARRYAMRETEISLLEMENMPAGAMLERLTCLAPNLTVYYLCKTFKEPGLRRLDVVDILSKQMVIAAR